MGHKGDIRGIRGVGGVKGVLGADRECRYSVARRGIGSIMGHWGLLRGVRDVGGVLGLARGVGPHRPEGV